MAAGASLLGDAELEAAIRAGVGPSLLGGARSGARGGDRPGARRGGRPHVRRARRAREPARAGSSRPGSARATASRSCRRNRAEFGEVWAARPRRVPAHARQLAPHRRRGRVHRRRLRGQGARRRRVGRCGRVRRRGGAPRAARPARGRRRDRRLRRATTTSSRPSTAPIARRPDARHRDALHVGHHRPAEGRAARAPTPPAVVAALVRVLRTRDGDVHLCTGPLYHAAPLAISLQAPALGRRHRRADGRAGTPRRRCASSSAHRVTHTHMVPTMFHRLLALPDDGDARATTSSSLRLVRARRRAVPGRR